VRFVKPVFVGDTVTVDYEVVRQDLESERTFAQITATNQHGEVVAVARHILKFKEMRRIGYEAASRKSSKARDEHLASLVPSACRR
jgi:hypothetical protein